MSAPAKYAFRISARRPDGSLQNLSVVATDRAQAIRGVEKDGLRVLSCWQQRTWIRFQPGVTPRDEFDLAAERSRLDVPLFCGQLASLLDAGLGIIDAIDTLAEKEKPRNARVLIAITAALKEGRALSAVMRAMPHIFSPPVIASVASSEETGGLATALRRYADNAETLRQLRSKAMNAAIYPLLLLAVGTVVVLFLLGFVVPRFARLVEASRSEIPLASRLLIELGSEINAHPAWAAGTVAAIFTIGLLSFLHGAAENWSQPVFQRLPWVGDLVKMFRHAQFYRTSSMLVSAGIPAVTAFEMCARLLSSDDSRALLVATHGIREGASISAKLQQAGVADGLVMRMLAVAERTGQLAEMLARIAVFQELVLQRAIEVATRLLEPVLMLVIGLVIGGVVVLMYLPIFDLATSLQ